MIKANEDILKYMVNTCVNNDEEDVKGYEESIGNYSEENVKNSIGTAKWDMIYNRFINNSIFIGYKSIKIYRGNIWTAVGVYTEETKELFLVFKKPNFKKIMKHPWSFHYATILNVANGNMKPRQQELFSEFEIEIDIKVQYDNLAEELFEKLGVTPERVILCAFDSNEFKTYLYNSQQQLVEDKDLSDLIEPRYNKLSNDQENLIPPRKNSKINIVKQKQPKQRILGLKK
ncbi:TPA: hypothetical protein RQT95_001418 [Staphylococcus aureus]|uniref:DUF5986 family protein n=1 Tax=Staphylococcus aureus TaxID=1280 RepID=UPI00215BC400|nr:DUF5986 family protein [Staphylococcus aureus]UVJ08045.1 DUF5986 family protein [Staphylococcus aureus]HDY4442312.1 hypothetical protein [Staphylococcus aureus]HDY4496220.1 hypothetical protein [Staphylococcus aureus]HDY4620187.1 hypothetical protein [Staphylococcus aureus]HDY4721468.1 hypothetical protein [Staphylococcus aureus]